LTPKISETPAYFNLDVRKNMNIGRILQPGETGIPEGWQSCEGVSAEAESWLAEMTSVPEGQCVIEVTARVVRESRSLA
jgi:hypothetical protein